MGSAFSLLLAFTFISPVSHAGFADSYLQETWSAQSLDALVSEELSSLDARKASAISAYNDLGAKLADYEGWCGSYGITALRNLIEGKLFLKLFSLGLYPVYHVYRTDPYFSKYRDQIDGKLDAVHSSDIDVGKCRLTEQFVSQMKKDPKHFDPNFNEFQASFAYVLLAGNIRLIEEERQILLELKGALRGSGKSDNNKVVEQVVQESFARLREKIQDLRARTLQGYELSFRTPLGALETYRGKEIGFKDKDVTPNFIWIFERRAFYVNQARLSAGKLFEMSVKNFTLADGLQDRFLEIIRESASR